MVPSALDWDSDVDLVHSATSVICVCGNAIASKGNYVIRKTGVIIPVKVKVPNNHINNKKIYKDYFYYASASLYNGVIQ